MSATAMDSAHLPYRPNVGIMLLNSLGQIFVARRIDTPDAWQMPQGGIDKGETARVAALRELEEEIGTNKAAIIAVAREKVRYDLPADLIGKVWGGRWRGQEQVWVAARFEGTDDDIDIKTKHPEFDAWKWAEIETLLSLIVPFKRQAYEAVIAEFGPIVERLRRG